MGPERRLRRSSAAAWYKEMWSCYVGRQQENTGKPVRQAYRYRREIVSSIRLQERKAKRPRLDDTIQASQKAVFGKSQRSGSVWEHDHRLLPKCNRSDWSWYGRRFRTRCFSIRSRKFIVKSYQLAQTEEGLSRAVKAVLGSSPLSSSGVKESVPSSLGLVRPVSKTNRTGL